MNEREKKRNITTKILWVILLIINFEYDIMQLNSRKLKEMSILLFLSYAI